MLDHIVDIPVLTVPQDIYDAILLAERVMVVADSKAAGQKPSGKLPDFYEVRRCLLTAGPERHPISGAAMVGG